MVRGDFNNVWPWVGGSATSAMDNHRHFDVSRLESWNRIFSHMQSRGVVIHLVLEDDSGWTEFDRELYYREMVARFSHHNGLIWNISEEYQENYAPEEVKRFARMLRELDPYDHPITVHHALASEVHWKPFVGDSVIDLTSFQTTSHLDPDPQPWYDGVARWVRTVQDAGRPVPISVDETGDLPPDTRELARQIARAYSFPRRGPRTIPSGSTQRTASGVKGLSYREEHESRCLLRRSTVTRPS